MKILSLTVLATSCALALTGCGGSTVSDTVKQVTTNVVGNVATQVKAVTDQMTALKDALTAGNSATTATDIKAQAEKAKTAKAELEKAIAALEKLDANNSQLKSAKDALAAADASIKALEDKAKEKEGFAPKATFTGTPNAPSATALKTALDNAVKVQSNGRFKAEILPYWQIPADNTTVSVYNGVVSINNATGAAEGTTNPNYKDANWNKRPFDEINLNSQSIKLEGLTTDLKPATSLTNYTGTSIADKFSGGYVAGFSNLSYGVYNDVNGTNSYLFVQGKITDQDKIPTTGTYTYKGNAALGKDGKYKTLNGKVSATVDFSENRKVNVSIEAPKETLKFAGNIYYDGSKSGTKVGNSFSGTEGHGNIAGGFFGDKNPSEIGGFFNVTKTDSAYNGYNGVFGATKTE